MQVLFPAVFSINSKKPAYLVRQLSKSPSICDCEVSPYSDGPTSGHKLTNLSEQELTYIFTTKPKNPIFPKDSRVLIAHYDQTLKDEILDLRHGIWLQHPDIKDTPSGLADAARESWQGAFHFVEEDTSTGVIGLRKPQIGALHAIHAHWSTSTECATVVMPTGTGKTETMLSTLTSVGCKRVVVVVPTDALRAQIAAKFESLGLLKAPKNTILSSTAKCPVVGTLLSRPKTTQEVDEIFLNCNVVITTSHLVGGCTDGIQAHIAELCTHLFIDEAHHSEAPTWKRFRNHFNNRCVLQFTATPFREDGQKIDGKLIYVYPLRRAQDEGYFRPIRFHEVREFNAQKGDRRIARAAINELDSDLTGNHIVMARVSDVRRAEEVLKIYKEITNSYQAVMIHSRLKANEQKEAKQKLLNGEARIVICVDMLGEGFDLPELKIAAFHDIRKSLAVTLQLAGRFTRARSDLGDPVFIANIALIDVRDELRKLYSQDPDWNKLLPDLSSAAIDQELVSQEFFNGFEAFLDEVPLKDLRPAASMVVYQTNCVNWKPINFRRGFKGLSSKDKLFHSINEIENTLVILSATEQAVRFSNVESIRELSWELLIAVWDRIHSLLFIHGSGNSGEYKDIAKALCGEDIKLIVAPQVFRAFHGMKRLVLNNVGLEEHLGRQVRYTGRMGSDVEARIGQTVRRGSKRSVLAGKGYENGEKSTVGAAKRGRVWSNQRLRVDSFAHWARTIGKKLIDERIDPDAVLEGTLKPETVGSPPTSAAITVDWPNEILERTEYAISFSGPGAIEVLSTYVSIEILPRNALDQILLRIFCDDWESIISLRIFSSNDDYDFEFIHESGANLEIRVVSKHIRLVDYFTQYPPVIWFADGSSLEGCELTKLPNDHIPPYNPNLLNTFDWAGVDISKESQGESKKPGTIQYKIIEHLQLDSEYLIIFDDDGAGEAADIVTIKIISNGEREHIEVELYHLKYTSGNPGGRVDDLYVVCGQAQRSTNWLASHDRQTDLFTHLLKRESLRIDKNRASRFERGCDEELMRIREMSRHMNVKFKVFVVQPGLSKKAASNSQLALLAVTERYLSDTYEIPFVVMCSE